MEKYTYSIANDFPDHTVASEKLHSTIIASLSSVSHIDTSGDVCDIWFTSALTSGEQITLDELVAAHPSLAHAKTAKMAAIDARTSALIAQGFVYSAKTFSLSLAAQAKMMGVLGQTSFADLAKAERQAQLTAAS